MLFVICDDDQQDINLIEAYLKRYSDEYMVEFEIASFNHTADMFKKVQFENVSAVFLDIFIKSDNISSSLGIDAARKLRLDGYSGEIIFITGSVDYYPEGFEVGAAHYIVKPLLYKNLCEALTRALKRIKITTKFIKVPINRVLINIPVDSIIYIEVYNHKTILHTTNGIYDSTLPLKAIIKMLNSDNFLQCFRSYVINMNYVKQMKEDVFLMKTEDLIMISKRERQLIKKQYLAFCFDKLRKDKY